MKVNLFVLLLSAVANHLAGFFFYGCAFSNVWFEAMCDDKGGKRDWIHRSLEKRPMWVPMVMDFVLGMTQSFVLMHGLEMNGDIAAAIKVAFWLWVGFVVPIEVSQTLWSDRPFVVMYINLAKQLCGISAQACVLSMLS